MQSIRFKIVIIIGLSMLCGCLVIGWQFHRNYQQSLDTTAAQSIRTSEKAFDNLRQSTVDMLSASVRGVLSNRELTRPLAEKDRAALMAAAGPLYGEFQKSYGITHWNYWEPEPAGQTDVKGLTNFARVATPEKYGEYLERVTLAKVVREKGFVEGLDLGNTGFALRVVHPVYDEGRLCGYFEMGKDIGSFLESMKQQTGDEYGLVLFKSRMDEKKWKSSRTSRGLSDNWGAMADLVLAKNTSQDEGIFAYQGSLEGISANGQSLGLVEKNGRMYTRGAFPLCDASGTKVGGVFVLRDITEIYQAARQAQNTALTVLVGLFLLVGAGMVLVFQKLIVSRLDNLITVATRVVGGDYETQVVPSSRDEIGRFEELFEKFRTVFVSLIHDMEEEQKKAA